MMTDRTDCHLVIGGAVSETALLSLIAVLEAEAPEHYPHTTIREALLSGEPLHFAEMWLGTLPDPIETALKSAGLSFIWATESGIGITETVMLHDAATGETARYPAAEGELLVRATALDNPDVIRNALRWVAFEEAFPALVIGAGEGGA